MSNLSNEARIVLEKRITHALLAHLEARGWRCACIWDGEQSVYPATIGDALAAIFNLDEASVRFMRAEVYQDFATRRMLGAAPDPDYEVGIYEVAGCRMPLRYENDWGDLADTLHGVLLVLGNGEDIVSDWGFTEGDPDGFSKAMEAFDVERVQ